MKFLTTVTGSYPRKEIQKDTLRKSSVDDDQALEMVKWAVKEQSELGLDIITDGEGYRENMYWFYQLRLDGVDAINKKYKHFSTGGSMEGVDLNKTHGTKGFGIECAVIKDEIKKISQKHDLFVVEDAAHAAGANFDNKKIGSHSQAVCFSFHPVKNIAMPTGGIIAINDKKSNKIIKLQRCIRIILRYYDNFYDYEQNAMVYF